MVKENAANTKHPDTIPPKKVPVPPAKNAAAPKETALAEGAAAARGPKATWRVTPPLSPEFGPAGQIPAALLGNDAWRLALETRDMLLWRRQDGPAPKNAVNPDKSPVTWHVKI